MPNDRHAGDWLERLLEWALRQSESHSQRMATLVGTAWLLGVGALDMYTEGWVNMHALYVLGVVFLAWSCGRHIGVIAATATAVLLAVVDIYAHGISTPSEVAINFIIALVALVIVALVVSELRTASERFRILASHDPLTHLLNRRGLIEAVDVEISRSARQGSPLSLIYLDVDDFKDVNDEYGHEAGDHVLLVLSAEMEASIRPTDMAARIGGDEFVALLPGADRTVVDRIAVRIQNAFRRGVDPLGVDLSIGCVTYDRPPESGASALAQADTMMYTAKRSGKGRVRHARRATAELYEP